MSLVPKILARMEPINSFNPLEVWEIELAKQAKELNEQLNPGGNAEAAATNKKNVKKADKIKENTAEKNAAKKLNAEVTRIRNSKKNLLDILRDIRIPEARAILIVQILRKAYDEYSKTQDRKLLFETMWAIESNPGALPTTNAPKPMDEKAVLARDPSLVYDDYAEVERLLKKCRKIVAQESDVIRLQLVEMSDSLPPLTKFNFGLRLDPWQKRVLAWIDAGKSVVICAPTSSGKTVLSSYVAIIFKSHIAAEAEGEESGKGKAGAKPAVKAAEKPTPAAWADEGEDGGEGSDGGDGGDGGSDDEGYEGFGAGDSEEEEDAEEEEEAALQAQREQEQQQADLAQQAQGKDGAALPLPRRLVNQDRLNRRAFLAEKARLAASGGVAENKAMRVLFVVPTEPLVWQVAAYFTKLLRETGDQTSKIALVTDQITYCAIRRFNEMPQIVIGTPLALETALTKPRGLVGKWETNRRAQGDLLPGGFDHFDWAVYDEVHCLDGAEGAALQRLIRSMNCKFLALSATVGNAEELRGWMERAKGDYILGVEAVDVSPEDLAEDLKAKATVTAAAAPAQGSRKVKVVQTLTQQSRTFDVSPTDTLQAFRDRLVAEWPQLVDTAAQQLPHARNAFQLLWQDRDLVEDTINGVARGASRTLASFGLFDTPADQEIVVYTRAFVNMIMHQGRFINLQRYIWSQPAEGKGVLQTASPLLAVESVESLRNGILDNSSLSFTSRDSYRMWEEIKRIYPSDAPILQQLSPYTFFGATERITLQRTKDYEDLLKSGLRVLAEQYPVETQELLHSFQISDPVKEFDLCDLVLELKNRDMLPCLPFHLNTFEAIRLFQHLVAGIEWRQKRDHPTYYMEMKAERDARRKDQQAQIKNTGKNEKALDEAAKAGDIDLDQNFEVDEYMPHPAYTFTKGMPISEIEVSELVAEMETSDGFEKRDTAAMTKQKGQNQSILKHALIRGLRRGIGLFINEVSFPAYRRAVQRMASAGKLAVVISDDSLAFGVNMPFRTCVFCGEMFGSLDELMAQQMSGRAGRRGLDTQGNLVYAGMRVSRIRRLMIGTVSNITGRDHNPRYESLILQPILAPRHVGWQRAEVIGGRTLHEHVQGIPPAYAHYTMEQSVQAMQALGFIAVDETTGRFVANADNSCTLAMLSMVWSLRQRQHESVSVGMLFPLIMQKFGSIVSDISLNEKKLTNEKVEAAVFRFFVVLVLLINRTPYADALATAAKQAHLTPAVAAEEGATDMSKGAVPLSELQYFALPSHDQWLQEWMGHFERMQLTDIPDHLASLRDPVGPAVVLDGTFLQCILDRRCVHLLSDERKQEIKAQLWHAGNVLRMLKNCAWPEESYNRVAFIVFRTAFEKVKYLNSELIRGKIDFVDVSALEREKRTDAESAIPPPQEAELWFDNTETEDVTIAANTWTAAIGK